MKLRLLLTFAMGLAATFGVYAAPPIYAKMQQCLQSNLRPEQLALTAAGLRGVLAKLGEKSDLFEVSEQLGESSVVRVKGPEKEWVAVIRSQNSDYLEPDVAAYWIGLRRGKVVVSEISRASSQDLVGPIHGEWRRSGPYLIGAGFDEVYHSPNWADGEFLVLRETPKGVRQVQDEKVDQAWWPFGFESATSLNVLCGSVSDNDQLQTLEGLHAFASHEATRWTFHKGRYVQEDTFELHDSVWAADRLMTAVLENRRSILRSMMPDARTRPRLLHLLRDALNHEATHGHFVEGDAIELSSQKDDDYSLVLDLERRKTGWILKGCKSR